MKIELYKMGQGFLPASEEAERVHARMSPGELAWVKVLRIRDPISHRRYWRLMTMCAENCERIELPYNSVMLVKNKHDVHTAVKLCAGLCDTIFDAFGKPAFQIPWSTDFDSMTADEWGDFLPRAHDVVMERILPGVTLPQIAHEMQRCMGIAA
jgi:hypothetical protein